MTTFFKVEVIRHTIETDRQIFAKIIGGGASGIHNINNFVSAVLVDN